MIKKRGREAEKEGDIREIGKKCLERKRKCNILNIYLINHNCTEITTNMLVFGYIVHSLVVSISYYIHWTQMCTTLASLCSWCIR